MLCCWWFYCICPSFLTFPCISLFYCLLLSWPSTSLLVGQLAMLTHQGKVSSELCYSKMLLMLIKSSWLDLGAAAAAGGPALRAFLGCIAPKALNWVHLWLCVLTHIKYSKSCSTFRKAREPFDWQVKSELLVSGTHLPEPQLLCNVQS